MFYNTFVTFFYRNTCFLCEIYLNLFQYLFVMRIIGQNIKATKRVYGEIEYHEGIIIDKYTGIKEININSQYRNDGTLRISVDYYILKTKEGIVHVECADLCEIMPYDY